MALAFAPTAHEPWSVSGAALFPWLLSRVPQTMWHSGQQGASPCSVLLGLQLWLGMLEATGPVQGRTDLRGSATYERV